VWFQNRRAKWRKKENTKKGPGRPAHNALPLTCSGDPIPTDELRRKEEQRLAKKRRRELERLERAAARKMTAKPLRDATWPVCGPEETKDIDVVGVGQPLVPLTLHDNISVVAEANCADLDTSETVREKSDVVRQVEEDTRYDSISEGRRPDVGPTGDQTDSDNRNSPLDLIVGTDRTSATRPPETKACPFSIESLLERRRTAPPSEHRTNHTRRSTNRTSKGLLHLQFQPVGFQVERLSPSTIPEPRCIRNSSPANWCIKCI